MFRVKSVSRLNEYTTIHVLEKEPEEEEDDEDDEDEEPLPAVSQERIMASSSFAGQAAVAEFNRRMSEKMKTGATRLRAGVAVARQDPDLHRAFLIATNPKNPGAALQLG